MTLKIWLKHPWYDPAGLYRRVEDNPHTVDFDLKDLPSTAEVEDSAGKREYVWKKRGEIDPTLRVAAELDAAEVRKAGGLATALKANGGLGSSGSSDKAIADLKAANAKALKEQEDEAAAELKKKDDEIALLQEKLKAASEPAPKK